jgi:hypothetical protein
MTADRQGAPELSTTFWIQPSIHRQTMTAADYRKALLYHSDGCILACGRLWDIVGKPMGAGVYLVSLRESRES